MTTIERIGPPTARGDDQDDDVKHALLRADDELTAVIWQISVAEAALNDRNICWPTEHLHGGLSTLLFEQCRALQRIRDKLDAYHQRYGKRRI